MPDPSAVTTWPAFAAFALVLLALQIPNLVSTVRTRRDTRAIRVQTENDHAEADYPGLRDELTATRLAAEASARDSARAREIAEATEHRLSEHITHAGEVDARRDSWQAAVEDDLTRLRRPLLGWRF